MKCALMNVYGLLSTYLDAEIVSLEIKNTAETFPFFETSRYRDETRDFEKWCLETLQLWNVGIYGYYKRNSKNTASPLVELRHFCLTVSFCVP